MPLKSTIAAKIFGLAIVLVCLMIVLAGFLLWEVSHLNREMRTISGYYQPLTRAIVEFNEAGFQRRIAFERWFGALDTTIARPEALAEASKDYAHFSKQVESEMVDIQELLNAEPPLHSGHDQLARISVTLQDVTATYGIVTAREQEIIKLMQKGQQQRATDIMGVVDDLQVLLQNQRESMHESIEELFDHATLYAADRYAHVFTLTITATVTSVLLGLAMAALFTRRLVTPVRSLMSGIQSIEKGDFSVEIPVSSTDELGALTRSFNFFVGEMRAKEELHTTFGKYIDPRILERVLHDPASAESGGGRQEMSVAFTDLIGFTGIGEHLTPAGVVNLLNRHFTLQSHGIQKHHGVIDKFIGDAVMAFWGPPFTGEKEHPLLACRAAIEQLKAVATLRHELPDLTGLRKNLPELDIRIGISTGEVVVGNIGSENTRSYTVIGDTVNLASRLEGANRFYGTRILLDETTRTGAGEAIVVREIDLIMVKGKTESTRLFELLGLAGETEESIVTLGAEFSNALAAYRAQEWDRAESSFREYLRIFPEDGPSKVFLDRIATLRANPPAPDWDGIWQFTKKK